MSKFDVIIWNKGDFWQVAGIYFQNVVNTKNLLCEPVHFKKFKA